MATKAAFLMRVYNTEEVYLRRAIESVLNQSEESFIFFLRDNGSTDNTKNILKEYAKLDNRIVLYRNDKNNYHTLEENKEREDLFNKYFVEAGTEYFAIIDSDDYYDVDFLKITYEIAKKDNADVTISGTNFINENDENVISSRIPPKLVINNRNIQDKDFSDLYGSLRTIWGKLYSRKWWERYWYELNLGRPAEMESGSDTYVVLTLIKEMSNIYSVSLPLYNYRIRMNSVYRNSINTFRIKEGEILFNKGAEVAKEWNVLNENSVTFLCNVYFNHIKDLLDILMINKRMNLHEKVGFIRNILNEQLFGVICSKNDEFLYEIYKVLNLLIKIYGYNAKQDIINGVNKEITSNHQNVYQEIQNDINNDDYSNANIKIRFLLLELPLSVEIIYLKLIIEINNRNKTGIEMFSDIGRIYFNDDKDVTDLIKNLNNM